eukprot:CAMPEP_0119333692 /NCGR_PEP_ID=MMETSP1333-20130426/85771_1 /TAXON_ID=418940 /ORGANISM="Scyphosphaera apsteinii, Strain RCC1455" /LENGTH=48 /DNA_ID= /DNA_START= /DNA_END= /DNA_ORIENTATION=
MDVELREGPIKQQHQQARDHNRRGDQKRHMSRLRTAISRAARLSDNHN